MERTSDRCAFTFEMTSTLSPRATRALVRRRSSCSRWMLNRLAIATVLLMSFARAQSLAADRDYLQRGEEDLTADYQIKYDRAVRHVLARGWRKDVVVRMVNIPPFRPESVVGIARTSTGYKTFEVTASKHIWSELGFGSSDPKRRKADYRSINPILHERSISEALSARIAALWRRVLTDSRNYGKDTSIFLGYGSVHLSRQFFTSRATYSLRDRLGTAQLGAHPHR